MRTRKYIIVSATLLTALSALTSCDKSMNDFDEERSSQKIEFTPFELINEPFEGATGHTTRGTEAQNGTIENFGVYAYYVADQFNATTATPNFMLNTQVEKSSGDWKYSPLMYWPNSGTLSFYAYAPFALPNDPYITLSSTHTTAGAPQLTYKVPEVITEQRDLLIADPLLDKTRTDVNANKKLVLPFKHALTNIVFKAKTSSPVSFPVKIESITIGNLKNKAKYTYAKGTAEASWTMTSDAQDKTYVLQRGTGLNDWDISQLSDYAMLSANAYQLMVLPQRIDDSVRVTVRVNLYITGINNPPTVKETTVNLNSLIGELKSGEKYSVRITVTALADATITCTVQPWDIKVVNVPDFN